MLFHRGDNREITKLHQRHFEIFPTRTIGSISAWQNASFDKGDSQLFKQNHVPFQGEITTTLQQPDYIMITLLKVFNCLEMFFR